MSLPRICAVFRHGYKSAHRKKQLEPKISYRGYNCYAAPNTKATNGINALTSLQSQTVIGSQEKKHAGGKGAFGRFLPAVEMTKKSVCPWNMQLLFVTTKTLEKPIIKRPGKKIMTLTCHLERARGLTHSFVEMTKECLFIRTCNYY